MKPFKRFKQSYRDTINPTIQLHKEGNYRTSKWIAYALNMGEMYEWSNDLLSTAWLYK